MCLITAAAVDLTGAAMKYKLWAPYLLLEIQNILNCKASQEFQVRDLGPVHLFVSRHDEQKLCSSRLYEDTWSETNSVPDSTQVPIRTRQANEWGFVNSQTAQSYVCLNDLLIG